MNLDACAGDGPWLNASMPSKPRVAKVEDAPGVLEIYNPFILQTPITFEETPLAPGAMAARMAEVMTVYPWLVCEGEDKSIQGYAYASRHAARAAYRWSVDTALYVHPAHHRKGVGRRLYRALFEILRLQGFASAFALIALPNPASVGMHEEAGFVSCGVLPAAGFKLGDWRDVGYWRLQLHPTNGSRPEPVPFSEIMESASVARILEG
jgi:phosphinothricin acetyltransferase